MKKLNYILVWVIALLVLSSGLMNIFLLTKPALTGHRAILLEVFPLEFLHLSKFLTLLIGVSLVVYSINIYKRKKRAFQSWNGAYGWFSRE